VQPEQTTDTPAIEPGVVNESAVANEPVPPVAKPVRSPRDRAERAAQRAREAARTRRLVRATLIAVAVALTGVFVAAARIHPYDKDGQPLTMSSHTQLGLPPCNFVSLTGKPCPSCGMTTSFALLVRGDVVSLAQANWVGSAICVLWVLTLVWVAAIGV
jgi:hypothetical protein